MQTRELNRATIRVANTTGKARRVGRIAGLPGLGSLMAAGIFVALALPARADPGGVPAQIAALQAQVTALQGAIATLQTNNSALQSQVNTQQGQITTLQGAVSGLQASNTTLQGEVTTLQTQLTAAQPVLALAPFVSVDPNPENSVIGPNIVFKGANIHIVSGSNATDDNGNPTGLGNLIVGYNEPPLPPVPGHPPPVVNRSGSHNLVIGRYHNFTKAAFGGLVAGQANTISNEAVTVSGGVGNIASGVFSSVSGGVQNTASGEFSSVSGGTVNIASGGEASVTGGENNTASGANSIVSGGLNNTAGGPAGIWAIVLGGENNVASGNATVVLGGNGVTDSTTDSIAPQPPFP
jgi:hypothetical protein